MDKMDKVQALESALKQIERDFGKGSIMKLGDVSANMNIEVIHTGCLPLDAALGVGGVPRGRIVEIFGPESSGKTTVALHIVAEAQKQVVWLHLSMLNTLLTQFMPKIRRRYRQFIDFPAR